jgi:hypothetical protein
VGSTHDSDAYRTSNLADLFRSLKYPYHGIGDSAYPLSQRLMTPYPGINLHVLCPPKEYFNYYHSQIRITSERYNGVFIRRWGIFWAPMEYDLKTCIKIIHACMRLHNFINKRNLVTLYLDRLRPPKIADVDEEGRLIDDLWREGAIPPADLQNLQIEGPANSLRERILATIQQNDYRARRDIAR